MIYQGIAAYPIKKNPRGIFANPKTDVKIIKINDTNVSFPVALFVIL